jgi:hypothetical protein
MKDINENKFSKLQYFFWLVAGSEIETLKKCPTDYNRHANIGLMIIMTSLFAGFTGFIAGKTFVKDSLIGVIGFAVIWAFLIFSLDRSMVNSIKKDPNAQDKSMMNYFWPRLVLAIILSFFMSIPLDHIVFEEKIEAQMIKNANSEELNTLSEYTVALGVNSDSNTLKKADKSINTLYANIEKGCTACKDAAYLDAKNDADIKEFNTLPSVKKKYQISLSNYNSYYNQLESSQSETSNISDNFQSDPKLVQLKSIKNKDLAALNNLLSLITQDRQRAAAACNQWLTLKRGELNKAITLRDSTGNRLNRSNETIRERSSEVANTLSTMKGFDTQFVTLFLMPNVGVQVLKWLIFLALLVIEILPTYLKLKTPIGQYDWEIYNTEKSTELEVKAKVLVIEREFAEIEKYRSQKELELNKNLIDKVALIEQQLAEEMLVSWEEKAKKVMKDNVDSSSS